MLSEAPSFFENLSGVNEMNQFLLRCIKSFP